MRLLFVNQKLEYASTTLYTLDLALALKKRGDDVQICTRGGDLLQMFRGRGLTTYQAKQNFFSIRKLLQFLREYQPELIHIQNLSSATLGRFLSSKLKVPHIITVHHAPMTESVTIRHPLLAGLIAVNEGVRASLVNESGLPKSLIRVIRRAVNVDILKPEKVDPTTRPKGGLIPVVGSVGRLRSVKGHQVLIQAARKIVDQGVEAMFMIVGEGEKAADLYRMVRDLKLQHYVTISPHVPRRRDLYRLFDIVVVPTLRGGVGVTAIEAMAVGKPVVASAVGELLHLIQDGETGLLVPEGEVDALAETVVKLIQDENLREALGRTARQYVVEHCSLANMIEETRDFHQTAFTELQERRLEETMSRRGLFS